MFQRLIQEGEGWRLGFDPRASLYVGLVAGSDWAMELTGPEFTDLLRLVRQLEDTMQSMAAELMEEERLSCEADSDLLWLEAEGFPHCYRLRLILNQGRRCEGAWPETVVPEVIEALQYFAELLLTGS
ncbi:DUF1818 family protein [Synechocystis sp. LKSZ1]|uniref:DUF1818 family protein n=1 Tax=Synechocystis sp. LKSZ1 TaxID=3144951 RepID=UPI00336BF534